MAAINIGDLLRKEWVAETHRREACEGCGHRPGWNGKLEGHHILPARHIKRYASAERLDATRILWDVRNLMALCHRCHSRHERRLEPILRSLVPACAVEFAESLGLTWVLDKQYPDGALPARAWVR